MKTIAPTIRPILWFLFIATWVVMVGVSIFDALPAGDGYNDIWARRGTSIATVVIGWLFFLGGGYKTRLRAFSLCIAIGATVGWFSDLIMAHVVPTPIPVLFGMISFGTGHIIYTIGYALAARAMTFDRTTDRLTIVGIMCCIGFMIWVIFVNSPSNILLSYGALGYALLICIMIAYALFLTARDSRFTILAIGAFLFLISDSVLGSQILRNAHFPFIGDVVWLTYIGAQLLIGFSQSTALNEADSVAPAK